MVAAVFTGVQLPHYHFRVRIILYPSSISKPAGSEARKLNKEMQSFYSDTQSYVSTHQTSSHMQSSKTKIVMVNKL